MNMLNAWDQFLDKLAMHEHETIKRTHAGSALQDRMPLQQELDAMQAECLHLTNNWYGAGNCSALYASFLRMSESAGLSYYPYSELPSLESADGYLSIFDKDFRDKFLSRSSNPFSKEEFEIRRFIPFNWQRRFDLQVITDSKKETIRKASTNEISKFCINAIPYQPYHGLGIADYSNNAVCDIEKVAQEAEFLNPVYNKQSLKGELRFNVGQNSHTGSSIPGVLHSHHSAVTIEELKLYYNSNNSPFELPAMQALLDVIPIGTKRDAFFIKIKTFTVTTNEYINFCLGLRLHLEQAFGTNVIDLHFHIIPTNDGSFVTIIAPFAKLIKTTNIDGKKMFINPETGQNNIEQMVAEHLHLANASKRWEVRFSDRERLKTYLDHGKQRLQALYDFTAKTGTMDVVEQYLENRR